MSNKFRKSKIELFKQTLLHAKLRSVEILEAKGENYSEIIDNFLTLRSDNGVIHIYTNGMNPFTAVDESYLDYDHFCLLAGYDELTLRRLEEFQIRTIDEINFYFSRIHNEFLGLDLRSGDELIIIVFMTDEIRIIKVEDKLNAKNSLLDQLNHIQESELFVVSVNS